MLFLFLVWINLHRGMGEKEAIDRAEYTATYFYYGCILGALIIFLCLILQEVLS